MVHIGRFARVAGALGLMVAGVAGCGGDDDTPIDAGGSGMDASRDGAAADGGAEVDGGADGASGDAGAALDGAGPTWSCETPCAAGELCCPMGLTGECVPTPDGGACTMPDLTVSAERATSSVAFSWGYFPADDCAIAEACVDAPGWRRLMRFETFTPNIGTADLYLGVPTDSNPHFVYSMCHDHYHFEGYANYSMSDGTGAVVATGHKQAFCLLDSERYLTDDPTVPRSARYNCGNQGIQRGWGDSYYPGLDCQWIDVTDVAPGDYMLRIAINEGRVIPELSYDNNVITVPVHVPMDVASDPTVACARRTEGIDRECGWTEATERTCAAGTMVTVGCGSACGLGDGCVGDPILRVCEGSAPCNGPVALVSDDDSCMSGGYCPMARFTCPASGTYLVLTAPYRSSTSYSCTVQSL